MKLIEKYLKTNYHTVSNYVKQPKRLIITTIFNEVIIINKMKDNKYEVFITTIFNGDCDYQSYVLDLYDLFKMLDLFINNFYRGMDMVMDFIETREEDV